MTEGLAMFDSILLSARRLIGSMYVTFDYTHYGDVVLLSVFADTYENGSWFSVIRNVYSASFDNELSEADAELIVGNTMNGSRIPFWLRHFLRNQKDRPIISCDWYNPTPTGM